MKKYFGLSATIICVVVFLIGCSAKQSNNELQLGTYVFEESQDAVIKPHITLKEDNESILTFTAVSSYLGVGTYEINENELIMKTDDDKYSYYFNIVGESLIFNGKKSSKDLWGSDVDNGSVFKLEN